MTLIRRVRDNGENNIYVNGKISFPAASNIKGEFQG